MKKTGLIVSSLAAALGLGTAFTLQQGYLEAFGPDGSRFVDPFRSFGHEAAYYVRLREATDSMAVRPRRRCELKNSRGEKLVGYYYPCGDKPTGKIAFIVHGYRANHAEAAGVICRTWLERGFDVFGCDHIASGEYEKAFMKLQQLFKLHQEPLSILGAVGGHLRRLATARVLLDHGKSAGELLQYYKMGDYAAKKLMSSARRFSPRFFETASSLVLETDYQIKTSQDDPQRLLETLILQLSQEARK